MQIFLKNLISRIVYPMIICENLISNKFRISTQVNLGNISSMRLGSKVMLIDISLHIQEICLYRENVLEKCGLTVTVSIVIATAGKSGLQNRVILFADLPEAHLLENILWSATSLN